MTTKYRPITAITELQVPQGLELDAEQWAGYFQPLVHAEGHRGTVWGRSQKEPGVVLLVTCKSSIFTRTLRIIGVFIYPSIQYGDIPTNLEISKIRRVPSSSGSLSWQSTLCNFLITRSYKKKIGFTT